MRNTIIVTVVLFLAVIAATIYYFRDINNEHHDSIKPLKYIPDNTFAITSIKNDEVTDNIFKDFELFDALLGFEEIKAIRWFKNDILRNEALSPYLENSEIFVSFHPNKEETNSLFSIPTSEKIEESDLNSILEAFSKKIKVGTQDTLGHKIRTFSIDSTNTTLYTTYYESVIFASYSKTLLASVLDKNTKHLSETQIDFFLKSNSRNTPFSVYFPHQQYENILKHFQRRTKGLFADQFQGLQGQSAWNINFKQDALMLTGESEVENTAKNYLALFRNQSKTTQRLYNIFPAATAVYMEYSLSNVNKFQTDLIELFDQRAETEKIKTALEMAKDSTSSVAKLKQALGDNFALIEQVNQTNLGFVNIQDSTLWKKIEYQIGEDLGDSIYRFNNANVLYSLYGDAFSNFSRPYFTYVNQTMVVANSSSVLRQYLADYRKKDLLIATLGFKNFEKLQGNEANVTLFVHNKNANSKILNSLPSHYQENFKDKEHYGFHDFYSWSLQLSGNVGNFSSQIYAVYKSKNALGSTPEWTYELENKAITRPYVFEYADSSQFILLQELDHTLHAIHPSGKKIWSTVIEGRIVGEMQQLEDRSLLFVTDRSRLYRIDTEGKALKGFSASISAEPIATPSLSTIESQKAILIPTANAIYAYNMDGKKIDSWKTFDIQGNLIGSLQKIGNQFTIGSSYGRIYIINADGSKQREIDIAGDVEFKNPIAIKDLGAGKFNILAVDKSGYLHITDTEKEISKQQIAPAADKITASFANITGNSAPELVLINESKLQAYEVIDSASLIFEHHFTKEINDAPQYYKYPTSNLQWIGLASKATNLLYLFNDNGTVVDGFPVEGQPLFYYGKINYNSDTYLLCMRRDHKLHAFKHQK